MLPLLRWGNCRWLVPGHKHVGGLVRIQYSHVTTHLIHYWLARNSTTQRTGESFQVQDFTFTTHHSPSLTWAIKSQGRVSLGFFLTPNMWFFHNHPFLTPNRPPSVHWPWIPYLWSWCWCHKLRYRDCPDFSASHVFSSYQLSEQVTETLNFLSTSMLRNPIKPVNKLRKTLNHCSQSNVQEKTQKHWNGGDL